MEKKRNKNKGALQYKGGFSMPVSRTLEKRYLQLTKINVSNTIINMPKICSILFLMPAYSGHFYTQEFSAGELSYYTRKKTGCQVLPFSLSFCLKPLS